MSLIQKKSSAIGVEIEVTEGTYVAPASATKFVQTLADGFEMNPSKELLERNIFTSSIGKTSPRTGAFTVEVVLPVEARASETSGAAPEYDALMRSALGSRHQITTTTTTKSSGNTGSELQIENADITKFQVGDIILIKQSGAYHVSPITEVDDTEDACNITLLVPKPSGSFANSVVIEKSTTYTLAETGHSSLSISHYLAGTIRKYAVGCKVKSLALEGFETQKLPSFKFGLEGLNFNKSVSSIPFTPEYDEALPPIVLEANAYQDGVALEINSLSFSLENTLGFKTATSASNGRIASLVTSRSITGTMDPYQADDSVANFTKYVANTPFSLFAYAKVPTGVSGQFGQIVAVYMPNCVITDLSEQDQDGLMQDSISFSADRGASGTTPEIYIAMI